MSNKAAQHWLMAFGLLLTACAGMALAQQTASPTQAPLCYDKEFENLTFLDGKWEINSSTRSGDGKWEETTAASRIERDLAGCLFVERLSGTRQGRPFSALAIMGFNRVSGQLQRIWSDSDHGILILYEGRRSGSEMTLDSEVLLDGKRIKLRNAYTEITKDSFTLESRRSPDDGKSWITTWKARYRRKG